MEKKNIYQRVNEVMKEVKYVQKEQKGQGLKYNFASHDAVTSALHEPMANAGIVMIPEVESYKAEDGMMMLRMKMEFVNIDQPEDKITMRLSVPSNLRNGVEEKTFGSTFSYACKYALLKMFMLETGEDADANQSYGRSEQQDTRNDRYINEEEYNELAKYVGKNAYVFKAICKNNQISGLAELTASQYQGALKYAMTYGNSNNSSKVEALKAQ